MPERPRAGDPGWVPGQPRRAVIMGGPRLTIGRLMIAVAGVAVGLAVYRVLDRNVAVVLPTGLIFVAVVRWAVSPYPRLAGWVFLISAVPLNFLLWAQGTYGVGIGGMMLAMATIITIYPISVGCATAWWIARCRERPDSIRPAWSIAAVALAINPLLMFLSGWPLQVAFLISRPAFDRLADRVAGGEAITFPQPAGLYWIEAAAADPINATHVALILDNDPAGRSGFVRWNVRDGSAGRLMHNLNFDIPLDASWRYQDED